MDGSIEIAQIESVLQVDTRAENTDSCFWLHRKHDSEMRDNCEPYLTDLVLLLKKWFVLYSVF